MLTFIYLKSTFLSNVKYGQSSSLYDDECRLVIVMDQILFTFVINVSIRNHEYRTVSIFRSTKIQI